MIEPGKCYLMIEDDFYAVFDIKEYFVHGLCEATDISFDRHGVSYTSFEEYYTEDEMESRIHVPSNLYDKLIQMMKDLHDSIHSLLKNEACERPLEAAVNNSYYDEYSVITLLEQISHDEWVISCFKCDDEDISPIYYRGKRDDVDTIIANSKFISNETLEKAKNMYYDWYENAVAYVRKYIENSPYMNYLFELKKALFYNNFDRTKELLESPLFSEDLLIDCGDYRNVSTPVYYITQLWNAILPGNWGRIQDIVDRQIEELNRINSYFISKFNVDPKQPLDYSKYLKQVLYCTRDVDEDAVDEVVEYLDETREVLNRRGFRDLDIDLYIAAYKFDYPEVERLLKLGADDTVGLRGENGNIYAEMDDDFLERDDWQVLTLRHNPDYESREFSDESVIAMFGSAAKYKMVKLFDKYYEQNHPTKK